MRTHGDVVTTRLSARLITPDAKAHPITASVGYDATDPYAVTFHFRSGDSGRDVPWVVGRELLRSGLDGLVGLGDVQIWPGGSAAAHGRNVYLNLSGPAGWAQLRVPRQELLSFLQATDFLVPPGAESEHLGLDAELEALTGPAER